MKQLYLFLSDSQQVYHHWWLFPSLARRPYTDKSFEVYILSQQGQDFEGGNRNDKTGNLVLALATT